MAGGSASIPTVLATLFTFVFQVQGELIVQSDNVTFPPYQDLPALFGPTIPGADGRLAGVLKEANPLNACSQLTPPPDIPKGIGWVALIKRSQEGSDFDKDHDECSFVHKVIRAQEAGAVAAIVFDNEDEPLQRMAPMPWKPDLQPDIPSVFISLRAGLEMQKIIKLSSRPEIDPIVYFISGRQLKWISIFTSTTVGMLAIGTVMVLFVFAKYQHTQTFGFPPNEGEEDDDDDVESNRHGERSSRRGKSILTKEEVDTLPKVIHRCPCCDDEKELDTMEDKPPEEELAVGEGEEEKKKCCQEEDSSAVCCDESAGANESSKVWGSDCDVCAVCIDEYEEGDRLRELPCGHRFHIDCIDEWLTKMQSSCPLCKYDVGHHVKREMKLKGATKEQGRSEAEASASYSEETPLLLDTLGEGSSSSNNSSGAVILEVSRGGLFASWRRIVYGPRSRVRLLDVTSTTNQETAGETGELMD
jgi:E3 ubiquitin-protein ligase RNF13